MSQEIHFLGKVLPPGVVGSRFGRVGHDPVEPGLLVPLR
jgi:hypothetical protein